MTAKEFINKMYPTMVENWSHQASMLNYAQVAQLMDDFHEEDYVQIRKHKLSYAQVEQLMDDFHEEAYTQKKNKPLIEKYLCIKDYHPIITTKNGKQPTKKAIVKKGVILTFNPNLNAYSNKSCGLYEYTLKDYSDCFKPIKNEK